MCGSTWLVTVWLPASCAAVPTAIFAATLHWVEAWRIIRLRRKKPNWPGNARSLPRHLQKNRAAARAQEARSSIVLGGCETHVCLLQTALELLEEEFDVWVVTDACSSRALNNRDAAFDRLASAGVELVTTEMVLFEWLRTAEHPAFKPVHALIK